MSAPKLRFKEFDEDWANSKLGDLCLRNYQGINTVADKVEYQKTGYPILQAKHITSEKLDFDDVRFLSDLDFDKYRDKYIPKTNDILFSNIGTIGKVVLVAESDPFFIAWNIFLISVKTDLVVPFYLTTYLRRLTSLSYFDNLQTGNATKFINKTDLLGTNVTLPSKEEQTKIASFLSAVDEKISQLTQKHELLSQYKQGMMRKLFSQQIRFKAEDGSEFGEWEETILSDVVDLFHGYQFRTSDFTSKGIAVIKIGNVIGNNLDLANLTYINENRLEDFKKFEIQNDDILMSLTGNIGRIIEVKNKPFILLQNYRVGKFIPLNESFLIKPFLKYLLASDLVFGRFTQLANQSAQANFGKQDMDKITVFYPSVSEQTKIANFLSAIDQKIEVVAQQIEQAKQWKKGLLQNMFV